MRRWLLLALVCLPIESQAGDWPQIMGPRRNGIAEQERLDTTWPASGPPVVWERAVGEGFAGIAVAGKHAILFHRLGDEEVVEALDSETGKPLWKQSFATAYRPSYVDDGGPRVTPLIHQGHVYVYGARGRLAALKLDSGKVVWQRDLYEEFSTKRTQRGEPPEGFFGFGTSPIVEGDKLLLNVGGDSQDAGIVAFDLASGRTIWKATTERASYSSPVAATFGKSRQVIFATRLKIVSVNPVDGAVLWEFPFGKLGPAVTAANPVVIGDRVFVTASYGFGAVCIQVDPTGSAKLLWESDELLSSQYTTSIAVEDSVIGVHGRQDGGTVALRSLNLKTKQQRELDPDLGYATLIGAGDKLLVMKTTGELQLVTLDPANYRKLASARLFASGSTVRALPALSNGRFLVRDQSKLKCFKLGPTSSLK